MQDLLSKASFWIRFLSACSCCCEMSFMSTLSTDIFKSSKIFNPFSQVAMGNQYEYQPGSYDPTKGPPAGYNSMWLTTTKIPDPTHDVTTPYGAVIPSGPHIDNTPLIEKYKQKKKPLQTGWYSYSRNEYVVYNEAQVQQRYLVYMEK